MKYSVYMLEDGHKLPRGSTSDLDEAKRTALRNVDDALPRNIVVVYDNDLKHQVGHAFLAGDGSAEWEDAGQPPKLGRAAAALAAKKLIAGEHVVDVYLRNLAERYLTLVVAHEQLRIALEAGHDPYADLIQANRDQMLKMCEDGIARVRRHLAVGDVDTAVAVLDALRTFHPMHADTWKGWPDDTQSSTDKPPVAVR